MSFRFDTFAFGFTRRWSLDAFVPPYALVSVSLPLLGTDHVKERYSWPRRTISIREVPHLLLLWVTERPLLKKFQVQDEDEEWMRMKSSDAVKLTKLFYEWYRTQEEKEVKKRRHMDRSMNNDYNAPSCLISFVELIKAKGSHWWRSSIVQWIKWNGGDIWVKLGNWRRRRSQLDYWQTNAFQVENHHNIINAGHPPPEVVVGDVGKNKFVFGDLQKVTPVVCLVWFRREIGW